MTSVTRVVINAIGDPAKNLLPATFLWFRALEMLNLAVGIGRYDYAPKGPKQISPGQRPGIAAL
jgi:hypothetical protein